MGIIKTICNHDIADLRLGENLEMQNCNIKMLTWDAHSSKRRNFNIYLEEMGM